MFSVQQLYKSYDTPLGSLPVLENINLEITEGSFTAIVGESGSGKSTLLQILGTLDHADSGSVQLENIKLEALSEGELATFRNRHIGFVYQAHHLIPELTALENISLPLLIQGLSRNNAEEKAMSLLKKLKLENRASHIPAHLSGGEAQRVAVARALITRPKLILADEPTGNLDETTAKTVFDMMHNLCKSEGVSVIMVTHSKTFAQACDDMYLLKQRTLTKT